MKIAFVTHAVYPNVIGGSELSVYYIAKELSKKHEVTIFCFDSEYDIIEKIDGIVFKRYSPKILSLKNSKCIFRSKGFFNCYDIVHFYGLLLFRYSYLVKLLNHVKVVATLNYYSSICANSNVMKDFEICDSCSLMDLVKCSHSFSKTMKIKLYRILSFMNDGYIVLSNNSKEKFIMFGFPEEKIHVLPNIIQKIHVNNEITSGRYNLLYTGRLDYPKGVDILIKAVSIVKLSIPEIKCYIVGTGHELSNLVQLSKNLGVTDNIDFIGYVNHDKIEKYYLNSDIFVFPVRGVEAFGRSIIEAMNYGLPIVTSDKIDYEIVKNTALIFENNDHKKLARNILDLFANDSKRVELMHKSRIRVNDYSPEKIIPKLEILYNNILVQ